MSEELISKLLAIVGPLFGTLIGGLITFYTTRGNERYKWQRERHENLASLKRDALAVALEWIEPMRNAETSASVLLMAAIRGEVDHMEFIVKYPHLLDELIKKEPTASQRAVLPGDIYSRGHCIIRELDELRNLGVKYSQEARIMGKPKPGFQECRIKLHAIGKQIEELEADLQKAYNRTFE